jgi:hypothetical protein
MKAHRVYDATTTANTTTLTLQTNPDNKRKKSRPLSVLQRVLVLFFYLPIIAIAGLFSS